MKYSVRWAELFIVSESLDKHLVRKLAMKHACQQWFYKVAWQITRLEQRHEHENTKMKKVQFILTSKKIALRPCWHGAENGPILSSCQQGLKVYLSLGSNAFSLFHKCLFVENTSFLQKRILLILLYLHTYHALNHFVVEHAITEVYFFWNISRMSIFPYFIASDIIDFSRASYGFSLEDQTLDRQSQIL